MKPASLLRALGTTAVLLLLVSCSLPKFGQLAQLGSITPTPTSIPQATPTGSAITMPALLPTAMPRPHLSPADMTELSAKDFNEKGSPSGVVLFTSSSNEPFDGILLGSPNLPYAERHLWAIAADGRSAGRISPEGFGAALLPPLQPGEKTLALFTGFTLANERIAPLALPAECERDASQPVDAANRPCGGFQISPDGHYLAYFKGPEACGRSMTIVDLRANRALKTTPNVHWMMFLKNNSMMLSQGTCEAPHTGQYLPFKDTYLGTGEDGEPFWNATHSAVLFQVSGTPAVHSQMWGFNQETSKVFMWMAGALAIENNPTWTPDGNRFLFQHRKAHFNKASSQLVLEGPSQILAMSAETRSQSQMAFDRDYNYFLCTENGKPCDQWYGDWVKVERSPFKSSLIEIDPATGQPKADRPDIRCALYGQDCAAPPDLFALNWKTGELVAWDAAGLSAPTSARVVEPDLETGPLFEAKDGAYGLYPGSDGRSLWYVPKDGSPVLWVKDGEGFTYLP